MRAVVLNGYAELLSITDIPRPAPATGEVLIKVTAAGLCHTDLHLIDGDPAILPGFPAVLGHETAGIVEEIGAGVTSVAVGDAVAVFGAQGCGSCPTCLSGLENMCSVQVLSMNGIGIPGGFADYMIVPAERHLVPIGELDPVKAAGLTDAGLTPYRAVQRALTHLEPGSTAVAIGLGGLGQFGIQYLNLLSDARIVGLDPDPAKRARALELGADLALDPTDANFNDAMAEHDLAGACSAVLDFVGNDASLASGRSLLAARGMLNIVGLGGGSTELSFFTMPPESVVTTTNWGSAPEMAEVVALAREGRIESTVTTYSLDDAQRAVDDLRAGRVDGRAVIVP
jgi:propanol-preferring alcohol dehydrogenase